VIWARAASRGRVERRDDRAWYRTRQGGRRVGRPPIYRLDLVPFRAAWVRNTFAFKAGRVLRAGFLRGVVGGDAVHGLVHAGLQGIQAGRLVARLVLRREWCCVRRRRFRGGSCRIRIRFEKVPVALQSRDDGSCLRVRSRPTEGAVAGDYPSDLEPVSGFEPLACRLQEAWPGAPGALPALIPRSRATNGPDCTACTSDSVHEPVHASPWRSPDTNYRA
jgi:hypothetical protein